jgi:hypothetical protein
MPAMIAIQADEREFGNNKIVSNFRLRSSIANARRPRAEDALDRGLKAIVRFAYGAFSSNDNGPGRPISINSSRFGNEAIARNAGVAMHVSPIQFGKNTPNLIVW